MVYPSEELNGPTGREFLAISTKLAIAAAFSPTLEAVARTPTFKQPTLRT